MQQPSKARSLGWIKAGLCLLLLCIISIEALHVHDSLRPLLLTSSHHCVLCMAAHLPLAVCPDTVAPVPRFRQTLGAVVLEVHRYESRAGSSLFTRPPPVA